MMLNNKSILTVAAGFPSPAENYIEEKLNLDKHLIKNKESTFFVRVSGDWRRGCGASRATAPRSGERTATRRC